MGKEGGDFTTSSTTKPSVSVFLVQFSLIIRIARLRRFCSVELLSVPS